MTSKSNKRWRLFAHGSIQGGLLLRLFLYWCLFQFSIVATIAMFSFLSGEAGGADIVWPAMITSLMVLPIVMLDLLKFSNRFAGPIVNISNKLKQMADGQQIEEIHLRTNDYCQDLMHNLNSISKRIETAETTGQKNQSIEA